MVDIVLWSFMIALAPAGLGLFWKLISGVGYLMCVGVHGPASQSGCH